MLVLLSRARLAFDVYIRKYNDVVTYNDEVSRESLERSLIDVRELFLELLCFRQYSVVGLFFNVHDKWDMWRRCRSQYSDVTGDQIAAISRKARVDFFQELEVFSSFVLFLQRQEESVKE